MTDASLYEILGILETASDEEIRQAYRRKMRFVHPDRGGSDEAAKQINAAHEVLSDPAKRARYDAARRSGTTRCPVCSEEVRSQDELTGHLVRHVAELEAARRTTPAPAASASDGPTQAGQRQSRAESTAPDATDSSTPTENGGDRSPVHQSVVAGLWVFVVTCVIGAIILLGIYQTSQGQAASLERTGENAGSQVDSPVATTSTQQSADEASEASTTSAQLTQFGDIEAVAVSIVHRTSLLEEAEPSTFLRGSASTQRVASEYMELLRLWDAEVSDFARVMEEPGFASHFRMGLLRRSDGYRLKYYDLGYQTDNGCGAGANCGEWVDPRGEWSVFAHDQATLEFRQAWAMMPPAWELSSPPYSMNELRQELGSRASAYPFDLVVGDCYESVDEDVNRLPLVECNEQTDHVHWVEDLEASFETHPGESQMHQYADSACDTALEQRYPVAHEEGYGAGWWAPNEADWDSGSTSLICISATGAMP